MSAPDAQGAAGPGWLREQRPERPVLSVFEPSDPGGRAGQASVRRHNLVVVLAAVATGEPISRARLAERTGLTRGTVSSLVEALTERGLLEELAAERGATGRPANPLRLNRSGPAGLGVEIGVDQVGACVVDLTGAVRARRVIDSDHRHQRAEVGLDRAAELAAQVAAEAGLAVVGCGLAVPGTVTRDGTVVRAPNLPGWTGVAGGPLLSSRLSPVPRVGGPLPVATGNEADLAALAQLWFGHAPSDFLFVSGGVGVGAGIVLGGELFRGAGGRAGELGHVVVDPRGPECPCGGRGCLEQMAGRAALHRATGGDPLARPTAAIAVAAPALGVALAGAVHLLNMPCVVLGGVYGELGPSLATAVTAELAARGLDVRVGCSPPGTGGALRASAVAVVRSLLRSAPPR